MVEVVADARNDQTDDDPDQDAGEAEEWAVRQARRLELRTFALVGIEADECASRHGSLSLGVLCTDVPQPIRRSASSRFILSGISYVWSRNLRLVRAPRNGRARRAKRSTPART
jgi:hypothetical protein